MARARGIKPGFFVNDLLAEILPLGRLLFIGLWTIADREGRLDNRPKKIKAEILPYDDCDVEALISDLEKRGFLICYEVNNINYIQIVNFTKHQNPHQKEQSSSIPAPDLHQTCTGQAPDLHDTCRASSLTPSSLTPSSLNPESGAGQKEERQPESTLAVPPEVMMQFETFWQAYPCKGDKKRTCDEWIRACRRDSWQNILAGLERYNDYIKSGMQDVQYIKGSENWLKNDQWKNAYLKKNEQPKVEKPRRFAAVV